MRRVIHISDVHFGRIHMDRIRPLIAKLHSLEPNLTIISGDLTQRARTEEFKQAKDFLAQLPTPQLVIPGNHDVPLYNVVARFLWPLARYKRYINKELEPGYVDEEIAVQCVNTARSLTFKDGRINGRQVKLVKQRFCDLDDKVTKIVVTHHPFDAPAGFKEDQLLGRARGAIQELSTCGADLFLAGHLHISHIGNTVKRYEFEGYSGLIISAGTVTSSRLRGEPNAFNVLEIEHPTVKIIQHVWDHASHDYVEGDSHTYVHDGKGWHLPGREEGEAESSVVDVPPEARTEGADKIEDA